RASRPLPTIGALDGDTVQYSSRNVSMPYGAVSGSATSRSSAATSPLLSRTSGVVDSTRPCPLRVQPAGLPVPASAWPVPAGDTDRRGDQGGQGYGDDLHRRRPDCRFNERIHV